MVINPDRSETEWMGQTISQTFNQGERKIKYRRRDIQTMVFIITTVMIRNTIDHTALLVVSYTNAQSYTYHSLLYSTRNRYTLT